MQSVKFKGFQREIGAPPNWDPEIHGPCATLPIANFHQDTCTSAWRPSWRERVALLFGGLVFLHVVSGYSQPPVALEVKRDGR